MKIGQDQMAEHLLAQGLQLAKSVHLEQNRRSIKHHYESDREE